MKIYTYILVLFIVFLFASCKEHKTNRQIFEENLDVNIEACIPPFIKKGVDSASARNFCRCALEKVYAIDSTFYAKETADIKAIVYKHAQDIFDECGSLINQYLSYDID